MERSGVPTSEPPLRKETISVVEFVTDKGFLRIDFKQDLKSSDAKCASQRLTWGAAAAADATKLKAESPSSIAQLN